jgi:hypothetical protein
LPAGFYIVNLARDNLVKKEVTVRYKDEDGNFLIDPVKNKSNDNQVVFFIGKIKFTGYRGISEPVFMVPPEWSNPSRKMKAAAKEYVKSYFLKRQQARMKI